MSRILVVARQRMLQQALILSLFRDHEVRSWAGLEESDPPALRDFDLVIIQAAALRDVNVAENQLLAGIQGGMVPTIWIEEADRQEAPRGKQFRVLKLPIQKEALQAAVATCLISSGSKPNAKRIAPTKDKPGSPRITAKQASIDAAAQPAGSQIIELVDVVDETPQYHANSHQPGKTN
ncbi:MAG: hypothetical protein WCH75_12260 [Candidatus Binatia bacterium]